MDNQLDALLATPIPFTFLVGGIPVTVEVHPLTILQLQKLSAAMAHQARQGWLLRLKDIAGMLSPEEGRKMLAEAAVTEPDLQAETSKLWYSEKGILHALGMAVKAGFDWQKLDKTDDNATTLVACWKHAIGFREPAKEAGTDPNAVVTPNPTPTTV